MTRLRKQQEEPRASFWMLAEMLKNHEYCQWRMGERLCAESQRMTLLRITLHILSCHSLR